MACHPGAGQTGIGPDLTRTPANHRNITWMVPHFKNPPQVVPGSAMPPIDLPNADLNALSLFVLKLTPKNEQALEAAPDFVLQGANRFSIEPLRRLPSDQRLGLEARSGAGWCRSAPRSRLA